MEVIKKIPSETDNAARKNTLQRARGIQAQHGELNKINRSIPIQIQTQDEIAHQAQKYTKKQINRNATDRY